MAKSKKPATKADDNTPQTAATSPQNDPPSPRPPAPARGNGINSFISKPVLFLGLLVGLVSLAVDYIEAPVDPVALDFAYEPRTLAQQSAYANGVGRVPNSVVFDIAERVLEGKALAAEDFALSPSGKLAFTGLRDGRIVFFEHEGKGDKVTMHELGRIGTALDSCGDYESEPACGRPLGLTFVSALPYDRFTNKIHDIVFFTNTTLLMIADAYNGVYLMDAKGRTATVVQGVKNAYALRFKFLNSIAVSKKGDIYLTESSRRFGRNEVWLDTLEHKPTGRLIHFNPETLKVTVLAKELAFPNGLKLIDNEQTLLMSLTFQNKLVKFDLATKEFSDFAYMPGMPDNLWIEQGKDGKDKLFVGLVRLQPWWYEHVMGSTKIRKLLSLVLTREQSQALASPNGAFAKVDLETGDITHVYQDRDGSARYLAGVHEFGNYYYLTSWGRDYLVRIPKKAFKD